MQHFIYTEQLLFQNIIFKNVYKKQTIYKRFRFFTNRFIMSHSQYN